MAKGDDHEEEVGGQDEPGGRHLPSARGRPMPGAITSPLCPLVRWWVVVWYPPTSVCARCRGHRPPLGAGMKRPVASPPLHNSPPGAARPLAPAVVGGGAPGSAGPLRSPGSPHCPYNATRGGAGSNRTRGPRRPSRGGGQGGDWGRSGVAAGGRWGGGGSNRAPAGPTTLQSGVAAHGVLGAPLRGRWPPLFV